MTSLKYLSACFLLLKITTLSCFFWEQQETKRINNTIKNNFTIGIIDDVTNLSLKEVPLKLKTNQEEVLVWGYGSDGMVRASKDIMKIVGNGTDKYVQSYNQYDSKKSGGVTICNLRLSNKPINAPFYVTNPDIVVLTKEEYLFKFDLINDIKENGIFVINTKKQESEINGYLPNHIKQIINNKKLTN